VAYRATLLDQHGGSDTAGGVVGRNYRFMFHISMCAFSAAMRGEEMELYDAIEILFLALLGIAVINS
jgi:hypothetical protein